MEDQLTLRVPREIARAIARRARERGVAKSQVVREALREYLAAAEPRREAEEVWQRLAKYQGIAALDQSAIEADELARQIRDHNWRE